MKNQDFQLEVIQGLGSIRETQARSEQKLDDLKEYTEKNFKSLWDQHNNHMVQHLESQKKEVEAIKKNPPISWKPIIAVSAFLAAVGGISAFGRGVVASVLALFQ